MKPALSALLVAILVTFGGCLATNNESDDAVPASPAPEAEAIYARVAESMQGLPCRASSVPATSSSDNVKLLADAVWEKGGTQEFDIRGDLLLAARPNGISAIDIRDPLAPVILGNYTESGYPLDVKFSPDNATAIIGMGKGIDLADVRNPDDIQRVGQWLFPSSYPGGMPVQNAHMVFAARIKGQDWVFMTPNTNTGVWILKLEGTPEKRNLTFVTTTLPAQGGPLGPHDMLVQYDPVLKAHLLYSADGYHGWSVFNVDDPSKPTLVGGFVRPESGYTHTIQASMMGNRRIVATIAEVGANFMQIYDATNIRAPVLLATWQVGEPQSSQHNFNIVAGKLYLAHYGEGIWVFDMNELPSTPSSTLVDYRPIAHYQGKENKANFWDVLLKDGVLYASDISNGLHVVAYGCLTPGDPSLTSIN